MLPCPGGGGIGAVDELATCLGCVVNALRDAGGGKYIGEGALE